MPPTLAAASRTSSGRSDVKKTIDGLGIGEVELLMRACQHLATGIALIAPLERGTYQPTMPCDVDFDGKTHSVPLCLFR